MHTAGGMSGGGLRSPGRAWDPVLLECFGSGVREAAIWESKRSLGEDGLGQEEYSWQEEQHVLTPQGEMDLGCLGHGHLPPNWPYHPYLLPVLSPPSVT